jgi:dethiobiotin synthetase
LPKGLFITGTDTGVGKTAIAAGLLAGLGACGLRTAAMKPVASGCRRTAAGLRNDDAELLQRTASIAADYAAVNPFAFEPAIAPHIAAASAGIEIDLQTIVDGFERLAAGAGAVVVEGAGGWLVPLGRDRTLADLAAALGLPVVLVVGVRLGCLNHALLSAESISRHGLPLAGWVANCLDPEAKSVEENIADLAGRLQAPLLGKLPFLPAAPSPQEVADFLKMQLILKAIGM